MMIARTLVVWFAVSLLSACALNHGDQAAPLPEVTPYPVIGTRHAMNTMVLTQDGPAEGQDLYYVTGRDAGRISVRFISQVRSRISIRAVCDGRARVRPFEEAEVTTPAWVAAGQSVAFVLAPRERYHTILDLNPEVTSCQMTVTPGGRAPYTIHIGREELLRPEVARLDAPHAGCMGAGLGNDPLERAFLQGGDLSMSCAVPLGATRLLPEGLEALNAKIEALTGQGVSHEALLRGDPAMPLDWSQAPQLDLIYVNYLNLNADFAGYIVARMLAWHAVRGTIVRILVSDVMLTGNDRALFEGLSARYPTVQIQPYRFPAQAAVGFEGQMGRLHRVTHVKLFATLARQAGRSRVMIGGRNIHEGYFFDAPRDLSDFPFLHQYDPTQTRLTGGFSTYEDFEIELRGDAATRAVVQHMAALWHRDFDTQSPRPPMPSATAPIGQGSAQSEGTVRHFISVPFADGMAQVPYYAGLIDAARHEIRISSPYLNLPPELDDALHRARARGVRVDVVTTVRVREATDFMVSNLNRIFANDFGDWVNFVDYDPEPRLLHAKLIVIDDRLTIIASTNLNQRSFIHDMENGLVIMDRMTAQGVLAIIERYSAAGDRVRPGQIVPRYVQLLLRLSVITRAF